jgi:hypothetical protein
MKPPDCLLRCWLRRCGGWTVIPIGTRTRGIPHFGLQVNDNLIGHQLLRDQETPLRRSCNGLKASFGGALENAEDLRPFSLM